MNKKNWLIVQKDRTGLVILIFLTLFLYNGFKEAFSSGMKSVNFTSPIYQKSFSDQIEILFPNLSLFLSILIICLFLVGGAVYLINKLIYRKKKGYIFDIKIENNFLIINRGNYKKTFKYNIDNIVWYNIGKTTFFYFVKNRKLKKLFSTSDQKKVVEIIQAFIKYQKDPLGKKILIKSRIFIGAIFFMFGVVLFATISKLEEFIVYSYSSSPLVPIEQEQKIDSNLILFIKDIYINNENLYSVIILLIIFIPFIAILFGIFWGKSLGMKYKV